MDAIEFAKTLRKICRSHTNCAKCELMAVQGHCRIMSPEADHVGMVAVAEQWEQEHIEEGAEEESRNVLGLMVALTDKVDRLAEKIKAAENMIEESRRVTDAAFGEVDERFAEVDKRISLCMRMNGGKTKKKRTRMDVLAEAFPEAVCDAHGVPCACPCDFGLTECGGEDCVECRREHWCAEVGE